MTTTNEAKEAIYSRFISVWGSETAYVFGNEMFTPPAPVGTGAASWVRLMVREMKSRQETLGISGDRKFERKGSIILMIYALVDKGEQKIDQLSKKFRDSFEGVNFSGVNCYDAQVMEHGIEGAWFRANVYATFTFYETK
jgi:hypothetical protein